MMGGRSLDEYKKEAIEIAWIEKKHAIVKFRTDNGIVHFGGLGPPRGGVEVINGENAYNLSGMCDETHRSQLPVNTGVNVGYMKALEMLVSLDEKATCLECIARSPWPI